jgi:chorismate lyase/3-hydroxybenzoate synthase
MSFPGQKCLDPNLEPFLVPFYVNYRPARQLPELLANDHLMALISFGQVSSIVNHDRCHWQVGLPELGELHTVEAWVSPLPVKRGNAGQFSFSKNAQILLACFFLEETGFPDLATVTYHAYQQLFTFIQQKEYPYLLRVWNYFPLINQEEQSLERYQSFCLGRHQAFQLFTVTESRLPAATAIGTHSPGLLIYFMAAKMPGIQIENPRQISAFHYPRQYGPNSPTFSRAILKSWGTTASHLYVSGTASIVGHESCYIQDTELQLIETLRNLESLIDHANHYSLLPIPKRAALLKIYIRQPSHFEFIRQYLKNELDAGVPMIFLQSDICRSNLLLEIEGLWISV